MSEQLRQEESSEEKYPVKRICSWCKREFGYADFRSSREGEITHIICDDCLKKNFGEYSEKMKNRG